MKKILSVLAIGTIIGTSCYNIISCTKKNEDTNTKKNEDTKTKYNHLLNVKDYIFGNQNDFTLIMNSDDFSLKLFTNAAKNNDSKYITNNNIDKLFINSDIDAKNIKLKDSDWHNIYIQLKQMNKFIIVSDGYIATLHIKNNGNDNYIIAGTNTKAKEITPGNINSDTNIKTDILNKKAEDCKLITTVIPQDSYNKNIKILFNIDLFNALNNIYLNDNKNFNLTEIKNLLNNNEFQFANVNAENVINDLIDSFKNDQSWVKKIKDTKPPIFLYSK